MGYEINVVDKYHTFFKGCLFFKKRNSLFWHNFRWYKTCKHSPESFHMPRTQFACWHQPLPGYTCHNQEADLEMLLLTKLPVVVFLSPVFLLLSSFCSTSQSLQTATLHSVVVPVCVGRSVSLPLLPLMEQCTGGLARCPVAGLPGPGSSHVFSWLDWG